MKGVKEAGKRAEMCRELREGCKRSWTYLWCCIILGCSVPRKRASDTKDDLSPRPMACMADDNAVKKSFEYILAVKTFSS